VLFLIRRFTATTPAVWLPCSLSSPGAESNSSSRSRSSPGRTTWRAEEMIEVAEGKVEVPEY
jgi:hypothetical protein